MIIWAKFFQVVTTITMPKSGRTFTVAIYADEYKQICAWVLKNQTLETGGDLFGLWAEDRTAVIQLVLGPGQVCRRAVHSFYQDVQYLEKVGNHLTREEGVCHIGEWHSHHTIGLKRPSGGDEGTVWNNMPAYGLNRFLLFIANIGSRSRHEVSVGCFLFEYGKGTNQKLPVLQGRFQLLPNASPFRSKLSDVLKVGAECTNREKEIEHLDEVSSDEKEGGCSMRPTMSHQQERHTRARSKLELTEEESEENKRKLSKDDRKKASRKKTQRKKGTKRNSRRSDEDEMLVTSQSAGSSAAHLFERCCPWL